ncbi:hypothetical protein CBU_0538 [Coxiella burnetii RSA 493]|uniref:Uncharacterized protein n=1 Tax=Coxiella burnetii (strain RSA 493 / Nine Mile phase I) TaxID=227377 RepID=Q83DZ9_COXBU|nr:hypothetical protein CBU_0538 [Coxiella burnetii RSA 493]BBL37304.1 hypothetical protein CBU406_C14040 [Coxiella burnetii]BBL38342.1 hypothetical protein CBUVS42_C05210 [Coxiella burnetii]
MTSMRAGGNLARFLSRFVFNPHSPCRGDGA